MDAIYELDNEAFKGDCTIIFYSGTNDDGERYVDATMVTGHVLIDYWGRDHNNLADVINAEDIPDAIKQLAKGI